MREQYIPKSALVAEIERRYEINIIGARSAFRNGKIEALREVKDFIDTLEVKEVDLEKEINGYFKGWGDNEVGCFAMMQDGTSVGVDDCIDIAQHFFELGLKAQKGK